MALLYAYGISLSLCNMDWWTNLPKLVYITGGNFSAWSLLVAEQIHAVQITTTHYTYMEVKCREGWVANDDSAS